MTLPQKLYHGTSTHYLRDILKDGLQPRNVTGSTQFEHTLESRDDAVYLTTAYPLYYAANSVRNESGLLLVEVDTAFLDPELFMADEDGLAQTRAQWDNLPEHWDLRQVTAYYRDRAHKYRAEETLAALGVCSYQGSIPVAAISRLATLTTTDAARLILSGIDPTITVGNYRYLGALFEATVPWFFGDVEQCAFNPMLPRPGIRVFSPSEAPNLE